MRFVVGDLLLRSDGGEQWRSAQCNSIYSSMKSNPLFCVRRLRQCNAHRTNDADRCQHNPDTTGGVQLLELHQVRDSILVGISAFQNNSEDHPGIHLLQQQKADEKPAFVVELHDLVGGRVAVWASTLNACLRPCSETAGGVTRWQIRRGNVMSHAMHQLFWSVNHRFIFEQGMTSKRLCARLELLNNLFDHQMFRANLSLCKEHACNNCDNTGWCYIYQQANILK